MPTGMPRASWRTRRIRDKHSTQPDATESMIMNRSTIGTLIRPALAAAGLAATVALAGCGTGPATRHPAGPSRPQYSYYRSMMSRYHSGMMMGGPGGSMMGAAGFRWMTGGSGVPGWMHGGRLPGYMMG